MGVSAAGRARLTAAAPLLKAALKAAIDDDAAESPFAIIHAARREASRDMNVLCTGTARHNLLCGNEVCSSGRPCRMHSGRVLAIVDGTGRRCQKRRREASDDEEAEAEASESVDEEEEEEEEEARAADWVADAGAADGFRWTRQEEARRWLVQHITVSTNLETLMARELRKRFEEEQNLSYSGQDRERFKAAWDALVDERLAVVRAEIGDEERAETGADATPRYASDGTQASSQPADAPVA